MDDRTAAPLADWARDVLLGLVLAAEFVAAHLAVGGSRVPSTSSRSTGRSSARSTTPRRCRRSCAD
ncbi:hypothetical protein [Geodermatophilus sabuli]|uniref:hypothetical protein n=1 Tax=Geodermatophilus sabuli TaxID=1564158 RepID=UPI00181A22C2|nr:hypothetical protein [Geodermatophilus sabuli]MBB3081884.1 hypothetical protein [Geodermatophilus sabuli]